jgi:hypothetical protein
VLNITDWIQLIGNAGFPVALCIYLLHRFENKIERLELAMNELKQSIDHQKE